MTTRIDTMASSDSEPLSEHRTSEIGYVSSPSSTPRPPRRPRNVSSAIHPHAPQSKRARHQRVLNERQLGVQSDDILPPSSSPPLLPSSPPLPSQSDETENDIYSDAEYPPRGRSWCLRSWRRSVYFPLTTPPLFSLFILPLLLGSF